MGNDCRRIDPLAFPHVCRCDSPLTAFHTLAASSRHRCSHSRPLGSASASSPNSHGGLRVTGTELRDLIISSATLAFRHPGNKRQPLVAVNQSPALIDRLVLRPWGSGVAGRLRQHPSPPSQLQPRELAAALTGADTLKDNNKAGMWREISGVILLD